MQNAECRTKKEQCASPAFVLHSHSNFCIPIAYCPPMQLARPAACLVAIIILAGCARTEQRATPLRPTESLLGIAELERAHGASAWKRHDALRADIRVEFGGK